MPATACAVAILAAGLGWFAGHGATTAAGKEPRFPQLTMAQLNDGQRRLPKPS
jgi:hypothetical protein